MLRAGASLPVLAANAAVVTGLTLAAGTVAVLGSVLAGRLILPGHGLTPAHGYPALSLPDGPVLRAAAGSVLYLALIALLSLGIATAVRDSAAAIGAVLGLLYLFPILGQVVTSPGWQRHLEQLGPMSARLEIRASTGLRNLPISPWAGLGALAAWPPRRSWPTASCSASATRERQLQGRAHRPGNSPRSGRRPQPCDAETTQGSIGQATRTGHSVTPVSASACRCSQRANAAVHAAAAFARSHQSGVRSCLNSGRWCCRIGRVRASPV